MSQNYTHVAEFLNGLAKSGVSDRHIKKCLEYPDLIEDLAEHITTVVDSYVDVQQEERNRNHAILQRNVSVIWENSRMHGTGLEAIKAALADSAIKVVRDLLKPDLMAQQGFDTTTRMVIIAHCEEYLARNQFIPPEPH